MNMDQLNLQANSSEFLRKRSLSDEVYDFLSARIIEGKYSTGDWLRQEDISTQLGVSQTPVREAFDRLVASGLAERVPYKGVRVPDLAAKEIADAFVLRIDLETLAVRLAAEMITPAEVQVLHELVERTANLTTLDHMSELRQLNRNFHTRLVESARNTVLAKIYVMVTNSFPDWLLYEYMFRHPELLNSSLAREYHEHQLIVAALSAGDPVAATQAVLNHLRNLLPEMETYLVIPRELIEYIDKLILTTHPD